MLENKLDEYGVAPNSPIRPRRTSNPVHILKKRGKYLGKYDPELCQFKRVKMMYLACTCKDCHKDTGTTIHVILQLICARHALGLIVLSTAIEII